jgi:chromosome partitioning protein
VRFAGGKLKKRIIAVSSSKGGSGKTTTLMSLADYWAGQGHRVALLDTDPNKSCTRWYEKGRKKGYFEGIIFRQEANDRAIIQTAYELIAASDILLIDVAGIASTSLLRAAGIADLVIIPAQPSEDDFLEAHNTMGIVKDAMEIRKAPILYKTVITRARHGTKVLDHTIKQLQKLNFPVFDTVISDRTVYAQARFNGATPVGFAPGSNVYHQIAALAEEVEQLLWPAAGTETVAAGAVRHIA